MEHRNLIIALVGLAVLFFSGCAETELEIHRLDIEHGKFVSAEKCGACHKDIHTFWKSSLHARSATNSIFRSSFGDFTREHGEDAGSLCLRCHAPTVLVTGDYQMREALTREGVTCDFCHSMTGTDLNREDHPFLLEVGEVKFGPVENAASNGHDVAYSQFHSTSGQCAGCHEYVNDNGVQLLTTYSEWQEYWDNGGGFTCQDCHMPLMLANIVDPKIKRLEGAFVNSHRTPGGHSLAQLAKSLKLRLVQLRAERDGLRVQVSVHNDGAGHSVPTGSPNRKVILAMEVVTDSGHEYREQRVYEKVVADKSSREIRDDSRIFTEAVSELSDTRISAGEQRLEEFFVDLPQPGNVQVEVTLTYLYSPSEESQQETRIQFASERKRLTSDWKRGTLP